MGLDEALTGSGYVLGFSSYFALFFGLCFLSLVFLHLEVP